MPAEITFPVTTIFEQAGTYTSDQNTEDVAASDVRSLLFGFWCTAATGTTGIDMSIGFLAPGGGYYELAGISNGVIGNSNILRVEGPIPDTLNVSIGLRGGTSATLTYWVIGQA